MGDNLTRRQFLEGILVASSAAMPIIGEAHQQDEPRVVPVSTPQNPYYSPSEITDSPHLIDHLAHIVNVEVPRKDNHKWGWNVLIQQLRTCERKTTYVITVQNEPYDAPPILDPRRMLTTIMTLGEDPHEVSWTVNPTLTYFVDNERNDNYMHIWLGGKKQFGLNNLNHSNRQAKHHQVFDRSAEVNLDLKKLLTAANEWPQEYGTLFEQEVWQLHRSLEGRSDPHSITTSRPIGAFYGHGVFEDQVYRVEGDNKRGLVLAARHFWVDRENPEGGRSANGLLERDDIRTVFDAPPTELALVFLNPDTKVIDNRYKIGNSRDEWARATRPHRPHLEQWTSPYWGLDQFLNRHQGRLP